MTVSDENISQTAVKQPTPASKRCRRATSLFLHQGGRVGPLIVAVIAIVFAAESMKLSAGTFAEPGPAMWPLIISGLTFLLSVVAATLRPDIPALIRRSGLFRIAIYLAGFLAIVILYQPLGFILSSAIFCLASLKLAANEKWFTSITLTIIAPIVVYVIFGIFLELPIVAWP